MSLNEQYTDIVEWIKTRPIGESSAIVKAKDEIVATFDSKKAIQVGSKLPPFSLSDATGKQISSAELLAKGPVLINFYRGEWCPFCSLELRAFQQFLPGIQARGVTFVAISPELPDVSLSTKEKHELEFTVLSDLGNRYAHELGIVYQQPEELRPVFKQIGNDLEARNGDDSFAVPIPTTILVDKEGVVRNAHLDADYFKRLDPEVTLGWIDAL